jgi:hypothetical protein
MGLFMINPSGIQVSLRLSFRFAAAKRNLHRDSVFELPDSMVKISPCAKAPVEMTIKKQQIRHNKLAKKWPAPIFTPLSIKQFIHQLCSVQFPS